jgi:transposase
MELLHKRCAGLDVHKDTVVACVRLVSQTRTRREVETFPTTTEGLLKLGDWLGEHEVTHAVMESTGVYWKPVWHVLESTVELTLANANEVKNLPGRKSDVNDAQWLADLLAHGLLKRSFVPEREVEELRQLTRTRTQLVREATRHAARIDKVLQDANIKMRSVLSKVLGGTGRAILRAIINGESDPKKLAALAQGRAKKKQPQLEKALRGFVRDHHRFLLGQHLDLVEALEKSIAAIEAQIDEVLRPFAEEEVELLVTIPGISYTAARIILAEIGKDMSRFPDAGHLVSWAGLCPRSDESAGKKRSTKLRKGNPWLKTTLIQCAWAAIRSPGYMRSKYHRIRGRAGKMKAIVAVAHAMLVAIYHMLTNKKVYRDLGVDFFVQRDAERLTRVCTRQLERLGYTVELRPATVPNPATATVVTC